jgi:hypothetical protein
MVLYTYKGGMTMAKRTIAFTKRVLYCSADLIFYASNLVGIKIDDKCFYQAPSLLKT